MEHITPAMGEPTEKQTEHGLKRLLMIVFHYPPWSGGSGIHRTLKFSRYLPEFGWQPIVLTANHRAYPPDSDAEREIPSGVIVERAFALDTARHLAFRGAHFSWMALPDRWITWWPGAVALGKRLIAKYRPHAIWSTYPIATAHLIALTLRRMTGVPWIADFRDPMTDIDPISGVHFPLDPSIRRVRTWIENPTIEHCTKAVFTTPGALAMYDERFPEIPDSRWSVIPNGYDEEDFADAELSVSRQKANRGPAVFVHSGVLYPSVRNPEQFFAAIAELRQARVISPASVKIVLRATGHDELYRPRLHALGIADIVFLAPQLPYREALIEMLKADGLLIFQHSNCNYQIPAKLYEYLRAQRPILALTDSAGDTAAVLRAEAVNTIAPLDSKERISQVFLEFLAQVNNGTRNGRPSEHHSRRAQTRELSVLLNAIV
jgi:glycosyltransferase involved in cell wall biosynthesis